MQGRVMSLKGRPGRNSTFRSFSRNSIAQISSKRQSFVSQTNRSRHMGRSPRGP